VAAARQVILMLVEGNDRTTELVLAFTLARTGASWVPGRDRANLRADQHFMLRVAWCSRIGEISNGPADDSSDAHRSVRHQSGIQSLEIPCGHC